MQLLFIIIKFDGEIIILKTNGEIHHSAKLINHWGSLIDHLYRNDIYQDRVRGIGGVKKHDQCFQAHKARIIGRGWGFSVDIRLTIPHQYIADKEPAISLSEVWIFYPSC